MTEEELWRIEVKIETATVMDEGDVITVGQLRTLVADFRETRKVIVRVLCGQALADHLGDIRDEEEDLWKLLGVPKLPYDHPAHDSPDAFRITHARLRVAGIPLPEHLRGTDDDEGDR